MKKGKFYMKIFSALLLSSVIPVILLAIGTYLYSSEILEKEVDRTNHIVQKQLQEKLDMSIESIRSDVLNYLFYDSTINAFAYKSDAKKFYLTNELLSDIRQLKSNHTYVEDVILYIQDIKFIMNCEGSINEKFYFDKYQSEDFKRVMDTVGFWQENYVEQYQTAYKSYDAIVFSSTLPFQSQNSNVLLAVIIDKNAVRSEIEAWNLSQKGQTFILDGENRVIVDYVPAGEIPVNVSEIGDMDEEKASRVEIGGDSWIRITEKSAVTNWKYVTLIPYGEITEKTRSILWQTLFWGTIITFFAILASLILTRKLYLPVGTLLKKVTDSSGSAQDKQRDEFSLLHTNIDQMILQNHDLQKQVLKTVPILQQTFFKNLLDGNVFSENIDEKMAELNISLPGRYFQVMLVVGQETGTETLQMMFRNMFVNYYIVKESLGYAVIVNFNKCDFGYAKEFLREYDAVIALGARYESIEDIVKSYHQAKYAYQYRTKREGLKYLDIAEVINWDYSQYKMSKRYETQYRNWMELEKNDNAYEVIKEVTESMITEDTPCFFIQKAVEQLYLFAEEAADRYRIPWNNIVADVSEYQMWKNQDYSIDESRAYILHIYDRIREYRVENGFSRDEDGIQRVLELIEQRYQEDISLELIADELEMSYSYLSKLFRKQMGEGFVEYLTRKRIEASLALLRNEDLSIEVISGMVGYTNTPTYIRNFKKVMGVPPGKYRSLL